MDTRIKERTIKWKQTIIFSMFVLLAAQINFDISQTIIQGYFNMMVIVDVTELPKDFTQMCDEMEKLGDEIGVSIRCQREDIFEKMHRL